MMKSTIKHLSISLIPCFFLLIGCQDRSNKDRDKFCTEYSGRPDVAITYPEMVAMLKQYDKTKKGVLATANNGENDTRVNFFKLEDLKAYLAYIEKLSKEKNIELTGVNIISAAYPHDYADEQKRNYQTLIFMPTTKVNNAINISFEPLQSENSNPKLLAEILREYEYLDEHINGISLKGTNTGVKKASMFSLPEESSKSELSSGANKMGTTPPMGNGIN